MALGHAIMTALLEDDLSGYELAKDFETSLGFFWQASHQQIYQELRKLADKGWLNKREVNQSGKPNKIVYGLTAVGRDARHDLQRRRRLRAGLDRRQFDENAGRL